MKQDGVVTVPGADLATWRGHGGDMAGLPDYYLVAGKRQLLAHRPFQCARDEGSLHYQKTDAGENKK